MGEFKCRRTYPSPATGKKKTDGLQKEKEAVKNISIVILTLDASSRELIVMIDEFQ